jgi:signal transduction histidine kinase
MRNLLDNAVRYSPPGTAVHVRVDQRGNRAFIAVADEGPGVPAGERELLGRRFHRLLGTQVAGTGLGLSIVTRIAQIHEAAIEFAETAPGIGLTVTVSFAAQADG